MIIAPTRPEGQQAQIWPQQSIRRLATMGELRPVVGDVCEQLAAQATHGTRLQTLPGRWCPDLRLPCGGYGEVKALGRNSDMILHASQREAILHRDNYNLVVILHHHTWSLPLWQHEVAQHVHANLDGVLILGPSRLRALLRHASVIHGADGRTFWRVPHARITRHWRGSSAKRGRMELEDGHLIEIRSLAAANPWPWWPEAYVDAAEWMLHDMDVERHAVVLAPAPEQRHATHQIRVVISTGPDWYRDLLASHPVPSRAHRRHCTSSIKRDRVIAGLRRVQAGRPLRRATEAWLLPAMRQAMREWQEQDDNEVALYEREAMA